MSYESLHFMLKGHDLARLIDVSKIAEEIYAKIMFDTSLLSFKPRESYTIAIYRNRYEYISETGYPAWSGGGAVTKPLGQILPSEKETVARTSIFTFEDALSFELLAHEISHLVFNEFMVSDTVEEHGNLLWLNEGFATYEEYEMRKKDERDEFLTSINSSLKNNLMPIATFMDFRPLNEKPKWLGVYYFKGKKIPYTNIDLWYWQSRSLIEFLVEKGGRYNFFLLLNAFKQKKGILQSLNEAYPTRWRSLEELDNEWRQSLKN